MPVVEVPPPYRGPTRGEERIAVQGATVEACLRAVDAKHPGFAQQIFDETGSVHKFVKLFINGEPIPATALDRKLSDQDELTILAAIAGGSS